MLFFADETWQEVGGQDVGALAAVAIPRLKYNAFCREVWAIKHHVLGAQELDDSEIKGNSCFAKAAFRKRMYDGHSSLLEAAESTLAAVPKYGGFAFAAWTTNEDWMLLRNPDPVDLSPVYRDLMDDFRRCMIAHAKGQDRKAMLFFDHRGRREDLAAACAVQNFIARVGGDWTRRFMQVPHFTPSAVSPGLQAADLIAYLSAHRINPDVRPELKPYWDQVRGIAYRHGPRRKAALRATKRGFKKGQRAGGASS